MAKYPALLAIILFFGGCATNGAVEKLPADRSVAVISAFTSSMRGYHPGITVFGNEEWNADNTGFDINRTVLEEVNASVHRDLKLVNGEGLHLIPEKVEKGVSAKKLTLELAKKLDELGKQWGVDYIFLFCDGVYGDSIGHTNQVLTGFGFYKRAGRESVFWVPQVGVFDCKTSRFIGFGQRLDAQRLPDMGWEKSWSAFGSGRQYAIRAELSALIKGIVPKILSDVGLTDKLIDPAKRSFASSILFPGANIRPSLTESNQMTLPPGVSILAARTAVLAGFKEREWIITLETADKIVGIHRDDKDEAICTVVIAEGMVTLAPEGYEMKPDGKRVAKEYRRWQKNLRESIFQKIMDGEERLSPPEGNRLEVPSNVSMDVARHAVLAGFKDREWAITAESDQEVTGVYRKGKKEAICKVTLNDRTIILSPEGYEVQSDGRRVPTEYSRWQNNLKESIFEELMEAKTNVVQ